MDISEGGILEKNGAGSSSAADMEMPGFRFHPTEEELLEFYLKRAAQGRKLQFDIIGTVNLYRYEPWELPGMARMGEREWYFFVPRDRKQGNGGRPNRTTERGFWKATGSDRPVRSSADPKRLIGLKKTLVFYHGRAPHGTKTDWVMNEYRLPDPPSAASCNLNPSNQDIVLCKVYRKATSLKELEQRAAMVEEAQAAAAYTVIGEVDGNSSVAASPISFADTVASSSADHYDSFYLPSPPPLPPIDGDAASILEDSFQKATNEAGDAGGASGASNLERRPLRMLTGELLPELQVPQRSSDCWAPPDSSIVSQLRSPWLDQWSPLANILNF